MSQSNYLTGLIRLYDHATGTGYVTTIAGDFRFSLMNVIGSTRPDNGQVVRFVPVTIRDSIQEARQVHQLSEKPNQPTRRKRSEPQAIDRIQTQSAALVKCAVCMTNVKPIYRLKEKAPKYNSAAERFDRVCPRCSSVFGERRTTPISRFITTSLLVLMSAIFLAYSAH